MVTDFEQLYYQDSYLRTFSATILEEKMKQRELWLRFDQTVFYPEGGGQPGDKGSLHIRELNLKLAVGDTQEDKGLIWHRCEDFDSSGLEPSSLIGLEVQGEIDWDRRFDLMQQHSAEHILSGLVNKHHGYDNVGFHINETLMTIDFSGPLSAEDIAAMEALCNLAIHQNIAYEIDTYNADEAAGISYRSKIELPEAIRLVTVPGYDRCACCGTQVRRTGELGLLKVIGSMNYKGGVRLEVLAGKRAMDDYSRKHDAFARLSRTLSSPIEEVEAAVLKLLRDQDELKHRASILEKSLVLRLLEAVPDRITTATVFKHRDLSKSAHKELARHLSERVDNLAVVYGEMNDKSISFSIIAANNFDGRPLMNDLKTTFSAKGGGKSGFIAGQIAPGQTYTADFDQFLGDKGFKIKEL